MDRHDRQARLPGVGAGGQEQISTATVEVQSEGLAGEVAARYLAGAGVGGLRVRDRALAAAAASIDPSVRIEIEDAASRAETEAASSAPADEPSADLRDPRAREVARGAREALRALRAVLDRRCLRIDDGRCLRIDEGTS